MCVASPIFIGHLGKSDVPVTIGNYDYEPTRRMIHAARKDWPTSLRRPTALFYLGMIMTRHHDTRLVKSDVADRSLWLLHSFNIYYVAGPSSSPSLDAKKHHTSFSPHKHHGTSNTSLPSLVGLPQHGRF